jgi:hypothetical protein
MPADPPPADLPPADPPPTDPPAPNLERRPVLDQPDPDDPKGLIRESFRIDGITDAECRSILIDWALSLPAGAEPRGALARLRDRHPADPEHPMARLMREAIDAPPARPTRRGGRAGRFSGRFGGAG